jgi:hypothetical protein
LPRRIGHCGLMPDDGVRLLTWCVVANVAEQVRQGEGRQETRLGLKHFAAGARLWVLPPQWGDGWENVMVVGRHRRSPRYVRMIVPLRHLTDFRVHAVYSPALFHELTRPQERQSDHPIKVWDSREQAEQAAASARARLRDEVT